MGAFQNEVGTSVTNYARTAGSLSGIEIIPLTEHTRHPPACPPPQFWKVKQ